MFEVLSALSATSSSAAEAFDKTLGARCTLGVPLLEDEGANFESGRLSFRSRSDAVVSLEDTRLVVEPATLRATLRIEAPEELSLPEDPGGPRTPIVLLNTLARREGVILIVSRSVRSSTLLSVGRSPVRVSGPRSVAAFVD